MTKIGTNIEYEIVKNKLTITVDLSVKTTPSKSGKTQIVASSCGNQQITPGVYLGLNCYKK